MPEDLDTKKDVLTREIADLEIKKAELAETIEAKYRQEKETLQSRWARLSTYEQSLKAFEISINEKRRELDEIKSRLDIVFKSSENRLKAWELTLNKREKASLIAFKEEISKAETQNVSLLAQQELEKQLREGLKNLKERRSEIEARLETILYKQSTLDKYSDDIDTRENHLIVKEAESSLESDRLNQLRAKAITELQTIKTQRALLEEERKSNDRLLADVIKREADVNTKSIELSVKEQEIKGLRQDLMNRMIVLDKKLHELKKKGE